MALDARRTWRRDRLIIKLESLTSGHVLSLESALCTLKPWCRMDEVFTSWAKRANLSSDDSADVGGGVGQSAAQAMHALGALSCVCLWPTLSLTWLGADAEVRGVGETSYSHRSFVLLARRPRLLQRSTAVWPHNGILSRDQVLCCVDRQVRYCAVPELGDDRPGIPAGPGSCLHSTSPGVSSELRLPTANTGPTSA